MKIHFRVDGVDSHVRSTVFIDGQNCGQLVTDRAGYVCLANSARLGAAAAGLFTERMLKALGLPNSEINISVEVDKVNHE